MKKVRKFNPARSLIIVCASVGMLAGCNTVDRDNATLGGATGAVIGGVATGSLKGAAAGAAIGAGAGVLIGRIADGSLLCRYRGRNGRTYTAFCR